MHPKEPSQTLERVLKQKPIGLRLTAPELEQVRQMAAAQQRSMSSMARLILLKGLEAIQHERGDKSTASLFGQPFTGD